MNATFTATFLNAGHAKEFAENAERTLAAMNITRKARKVEFEVKVEVGLADTYGDVQLTVHHYGTDRAKVTYTPDHEIEDPMDAQGPEPVFAPAIPAAEESAAPEGTQTDDTAVVEKAVRRRGPAKTGNPQSDRKANDIKMANAVDAATKINTAKNSVTSAKAVKKTPAKKATPGKPAEKPASVLKPVTATIQAKVPAGYVPRYAHKSYDLYSTLPGQGKIQWLVVCNAHGTHTAAAGGREGDVLGSKAGRQGWCAKCETEGSTAAGAAKSTK